MQENRRATCGRQSGSARHPGLAAADRLFPRLVSVCGSLQPLLLAGARAGFRGAGRAGGGRTHCPRAGQEQSAGSGRAAFVRARRQPVPHRAGQGTFGLRRQRSTRSTRHRLAWPAPRPICGWRGQACSKPARMRAGRKSCIRKTPAPSRSGAWKSRVPPSKNRVAGSRPPRRRSSRRANRKAARWTATPKLLSARQAVEKAELDMKHAVLRAPGQGLVTDLRTDAGQFAAAGTPLLTLIAVHDLWISADMTENNLSQIQPGNPVEIVLDALPGQVFKGKVRSIGRGVEFGPVHPGRPAHHPERRRLAAAVAAFSGRHRIRSAGAESRSSAAPGSAARPM